MLEAYEGHHKECYYCGKECNALAGNPSEWPIPLTHKDEPGKSKWHHIGCVSERLIENGSHEAAKQLRLQLTEVQNFIIKEGLYEKWISQRDSSLYELDR